MILGRLPGCEVVLDQAASVLGRVGSRRALVVTDPTVAALVPELTAQFPVVTVEPGEEHKSLESAQRIYDACLAAELDRGGVIVGVGGGVICDLAGFAASTWMRGCALILVPTTLLAQVDAAVGGKTAVNHAGTKNLVGTFHPAEAVVEDPAFLSTLPAELLVEGYAEFLKHGLIADRGLVEACAALPAPLRAADLMPLLGRSVQVKLDVVAEDPTERGRRALLNYGHTLGHAVEACTGLRHGMAVAVGMATMARWAAGRGLLPADEAATVTRLLARAGLPTSLPAAAVERDRLRELIWRDKKRRGDALRIVLLRELGRADVLDVGPGAVDELVDLLGADDAVA